MQLDSSAVLDLIPGLYIAIGGIVFALGLGLSAICLLRNPSPDPGQGKGSSGSGAESALDADARRYAARLGLVGAIIKFRRRKPPTFSRGRKPPFSFRSNCLNRTVVLYL